MPLLNNYANNRINRIIFSFLLIILCSVQAFSTGGILAGSGTYEDPYQVADYADLKTVADSAGLYKFFCLVADINASASAAEDSGRGFMPIGSNSSPFTGVFNGSGKRITNLTINRPSASYIGLFGVIGENSSVDSLGLENVSIVGNIETGSLTGANKGTISDCYAYGSVTGNAGTGGLIGVNSNIGQVYNSYFHGDVSGSDEVGGLCGVNSSTLENSHFSGSVTGHDEVGGLVGYNFRGSVNYCYAAGDVAGNENVGGLIGMQDYVLQYSFATGSVSGNRYVGGLNGWTDNGSKTSFCYSTGPVTGQNEAGGLTGHNEGGTIQYDYTTSSVTCTYKYGYAGGFMANTNSFGKVSFCYAAGQVQADTFAAAFTAITNSNDTVSSCCWDSITTGVPLGCRYNSGVFSAEGLTTAQMKESANFIGWNFSTIWKIRTDSTYPGLRGIDNAPFAFSDSLKTGRTIALSELLKNDCDIETGKANLILRVRTLNAGTTDSTSTLYLPLMIPDGYIDTITYRVGEVRPAIGDTLWGNITTAVIVLDTTFTTGIYTQRPNIPGSFALDQNYPNPFNPATTIGFTLPEETQITLKIFDIMGREITTLINELVPAGMHSVKWDASRFASGVYFYKMIAGKYSDIKKLVLMK